MEPQNPSNSLDIACTSKMKRGKNYEKKEKEKKRVMKGLAGMSLADLDQESSDHSSGQTKRAILYNKPKGLSSATNRKILYPLQQTSHRNMDNMKSLMICKEAKPRKRRLAQATQLVMLGL